MIVSILRERSVEVSNQTGFEPVVKIEATKPLVVVASLSMKSEVQEKFSGLVDYLWIEGEYLRNLDNVVDKTVVVVYDPSRGNIYNYGILCIIAQFKGWDDIWELDGKFLMRVSREDIYLR